VAKTQLKTDIEVTCLLLYLLHISRMVVDQHGALTLWWLTREKWNI